MGGCIKKSFAPSLNMGSEAVSGLVDSAPYPLVEGLTLSLGPENIKYALRVSRREDF